MDNATEYYKKAILRFVTTGNINSIKEMWTKLVSLIPQEIDFFQLVKRKIAKTLGEDKTAILLQELYAWYKDNKKWDGYLITMLELLLGRRVGDTVSMKWSDFYYENVTKVYLLYLCNYFVFEISTKLYQFQ